VYNPGRTIHALGLLLVFAATSGLAVLTLTMPANVQAQQQRVEVQLNSNRVSVDESVILNVRAYGLDAEIITSALDKDFDVAKRSSSRQVSIENGKRTSLVEWVLELSPKRAGALEIPPITVGSEQSRPLTLLVEAPASGPGRDMYLEASVDISDPYVQAQVIYTLRVYQDVRFLEANLPLPEVDDVLIQQISEEKNYQETVEGRTYVVSEIRYSVFPQQSGTVIIPAFVLQAVIAADKNQVPNTRTRTRRLKRRSNQIELNVKPRPDGMAGSWWLPAQAVNLQSQWSTPIDAMTVDQPVTRTIQLMATGVGDEQLPELDVPVVDNISIYADNPTAATSTTEQGLVSQQTNTWAVIPQQAGELVLPEMKVNWFDTVTGEARVATLPAETITVAPSAASKTNGDSDSSTGSENNSATDQADQGVQTSNTNDSDTVALLENAPAEPMTNLNTTSSESSDEAVSLSNVANATALQAVSRWRNIVIALLIGWALSLLGLWLWMRKRYSLDSDPAGTQRSNNESSTMRFQRRAGSRAALNPIKEACDSGDASKISKEVLSWAAMVWPDNAPTHISSVAERLNSAELTRAFDSIDAQQYRPAGSVKPMAVDQIPAILKKAIDQIQEDGPGTSETNALPSL